MVLSQLCKYLSISLIFSSLLILLILLSFAYSSYSLVLLILLLFSLLLSLSLQLQTAHSEFKFLQVFSEFLTWWCKALLPLVLSSTFANRVLLQYLTKETNVQDFVHMKNSHIVTNFYRSMRPEQRSLLFCHERSRAASISGVSGLCALSGTI